MAINANIASNILFIQKSNFQFTVILDISQTSRLDESSFTLSNLNVSGSTDVSISNLTLLDVSQNAALIAVALPDEVRGHFIVGVTGSITVDGTAETLTGTAKTLQYNTVRTVKMKMG